MTHFEKSLLVLFEGLPLVFGFKSDIMHHILLSMVLGADSFALYLWQIVCPKIFPIRILI